MGTVTERLLYCHTVKHLIDTNNWSNNWSDIYNSPVDIQCLLTATHSVSHPVATPRKNLWLRQRLRSLFIL